MLKPSVLILGAAGHSVDIATLPAFLYWQNEGVLGNIIAFDRWAPSHYSAGSRGYTFVTGDALNLGEVHKAVAKLESKTSIFYCALPPHLYLQALTILVEAIRDSHITNSLLALEKPVGLDAASAKAIQQVASQFTRVCYVDHYLGKLAHIHYPPMPVPSEISQVVIEAIETDPVDHSRLESWNHYGILGDMVQSHLLQLLASLLAPENKVEFLRSLRPEFVALSTYGTYPARMEQVLGHPPTSIASTWVDMELESSDPAMPRIQITSGKAMTEKRTQVVFFLKDKTHLNLSLPRLSLKDYIPIVGGMIDVQKGLPSKLFVSFEEVLASWNLIERALTKEH